MKAGILSTRPYVVGATIAVTATGTHESWVQALKFDYQPTASARPLTCSLFEPMLHPLLPPRPCVMEVFRLP
jgi:hypothetical protein